MLSCYVVSLPFLRSFAVLPVFFTMVSPFRTFLSHLRSLVSFFSLVFAWPCLALSCHVLFCSCLFRRGRPARVDRRAGGRSGVGQSSGGRSGWAGGRRACGRTDRRALFFCPVSFESFSVNPFSFHAALLYESPRRKLG